MLSADEIFPVFALLFFAHLLVLFRICEVSCFFPRWSRLVDISRSLVFYIIEIIEDEENYKNTNYESNKSLEDLLCDWSIFLHIKLSALTIRNSSDLNSYLYPNQVHG